jgi:hypothetical protein
MFDQQAPESVTKLKKKSFSGEQLGLKDYGHFLPAALVSESELVVD